MVLQVFLLLFSPSQAIVRVLYYINLKSKLSCTMSLLILLISFGRYFKSITVLKYLPIFPHERLQEFQRD